MKNSDEDIAAAVPEAVPKGDGLDVAGGQARQEPLDMRGDLDNNIGVLLEMMTELKTEITDEWRRVKLGEASDQDLKRKIKTDLAALVALTIQQESKLHDFTSQRAGKAGEFALDLGAARTSIWGRLARLRDAQAAGGLS